MPLTEQQQKAVESNSQYIAIIAGAGSGKTKTLTDRICNLITIKNIKPDEVLALTFSSKAAQEMKKRIIQNLGEESKGIWIKTFHSFGLELLRLNQQALDNTAERFEIIDTTTRTRYIKNIINIYEINDFPQEVLQHISKIKNKIIECSPNFKPVFDAYNKVLQDNNLVDLDDLIWLTVNIMKKDENLRQYLHKRFKHILIDEYQDTNDIQNEMIKLILSPTASLCVVGDDDQCIYEWRGSKPQYIREFAIKSNVETIFLNDNFRSQNYVVELANKFIANNQDRIEKSMIPRIETKIKPLFRRFYDANTEAEFIAKTIKNLYNSGLYKYSDIAILLRSSSLQAQIICSELVQQGITFNTKQDEINTEFIPILTVLYAIISYKNNNNIARAINFPDISLDNFTYMDLKEENRLEHLSTIDCLEHIFNSSLTWEKCDIFRRRYEFIKKLYKIHKSEEYKASDIILEVLNFYKSEQNHNYEINKQIENIASIFKLSKTWENISDDTTLSSFIDYLVCAIENNEDLHFDNSEDSINIMTCHKAKGLEFPVVIIPGVNVGTFPNDYFVTNKNKLEEERRLFYVAMTRAVERLVITCNQHPYATKNNKYIENGFVAEIPEIVNWSKYN